MRLDDNVLKQCNYKNKYLSDDVFEECKLVG